EINKNITETLSDSLRSTGNKLSVLANITENPEILENHDIFTRVMWEQLKSDRNLSSIYAADMKGNFIQIRREPELALRVLDSAAATDEYLFKNNDFSDISAQSAKADYDPRTRTWFRNVSPAHRMYWSEPYFFASTGEPGITVSVAALDKNGKVIYVCGADYTLKSLSDMLKSKTSLVRGMLILFSSQQEVIAASFSYKSVDTLLPKIKDLGMKGITEVFTSAMNGSSIGELENGEGASYVYFITPVPGSIGNKWFLASLVDKASIKENINQTLLITIAISVIIMGLIYFPVSYIIRKMFIHPIDRLKKMTADISVQNYDSTEIIYTRIDEFYKLSISLVNMANAIKRYEADQIKLTDSFIKILAGAIDAKSPYTGGHCERVPVIAEMLAKAADASSEGKFGSFSFKSQNEWREFKVAAWLHDCGKVVTPEYVVDKATKLETIYNRIHEIRTRFEVLNRDSVIEYHEKLAAEPERKSELEAELAERQSRLKDDFAFIAECNIGGEFMDESRTERLKEIAKTEWTRNFSDRLGLSGAEMLRIRNIPEPSLPCTEKLLADKTEHIINHERPVDPAEYEELRFRVDVPENFNNRGELYNLLIGRGTLNNEERFKINEHMIMTIKMLESIPFTDDLKRVPEYAGAHHETLKGTGYPRKLSAEDISIPARIMALADIFEALTACDRPYKNAKPLSEALKIMSFMAKDRHIDSELFELFLRSGVYMEYAEKYLHKNQIDNADIEDLIEKAKS
ncbi:MAG: HD domain-containing phosphohydrolase, partial [Deferribacterales bacterium]